MRRSLWIAGLVIGWSGAAAAQETLMIPNDREASAQVARIVETARAANLPTNPIVGKVNFGLLRKSKPDAIVRAASTVRLRLEAARDALAPRPTQQEITEGANALGENATVAALREVRKAGGSQSVAAALGLLTQMLASQVSLATATEAVTDLLRRGAQPGQLVAMGNDLETDMGNGTTIESSLDVRRHALIAALAAQNAANLSAADVSAPGLTNTAKSNTGPPTPPKRP
jgi:hypothetical protein